MRKKLRKEDEDKGVGTLRSCPRRVKQKIIWLHQFRRLRLRYEKRADMHKAFYRSRAL